MGSVGLPAARRADGPALPAMSAESWQASRSALSAQPTC